jgi:dienelactone hydrolase
MKGIFFLAALTLYAYTLSAQKTPLTIEAIKNWPKISNEFISNDGKFVIYEMDNVAQDTLVIQPVDGRWAEKISGIKKAIITENSRWVIYLKNDSVFIFDLQTRRIRSGIGNIHSFKTPLAGNGQWLACLDKSPEKKLMLYDLVNNKTNTYEHVGFYTYSKNGTVLLLQSNPDNSNNAGSVLLWVDLKQTKTDTILNNGRNAGNFAFDETATQLAFTAEESRNGNYVTSLWYYRRGMDTAVVKVNETISGINSQYTVAAGLTRFSPDGRRLFFMLKNKTENHVKNNNNNADINIWHYDDDYLQTEQAAMLYGAANRSYTAVLHLNDNSIVQIDQEKDERFFELAADGNGDFAIVKQNNNYFAGKWKSSTIPSYHLVNIKNGLRTHLISQRDITITISPTGKYVTWYDPVKKSYFAYETADNSSKEITRQLAGSLTPAIAPGRIQPFLPVGIAGWLANDEALLIYDEFDIWKIDPTGQKAPVNITNGYGRSHHIMLRIWNEDNRDYAAPVIKNEELLLVAFDIDNKNNGFFKTAVSKIKDPVKLSLGPYLYYNHLRFNFEFLQKCSLWKARNAQVYMLRRMSAREYPNIYITRDFKEFTAISNLQPQQPYNWLTAEMVTWQQPNGTRNQGLLYKPENFDPQKKYPVIFYFYEKLSQRLNQYLQPELSEGSINIPLYVSNGYVIFTPDISYEPGRPGESACISIESAARYLSQMPWIDAQRMGLQGHSFGGYQVNYLVTHSNLFAAAQESAGASDFISYYNGFYREHSAQFYFEYGQGRLGYTLWEKPELYIQNSPIFKADQVQTPLLIMHNKDDGEVPFQQGIEWFTALRRLGKKVWMLQYDKEYHGINQQKNKTDFSIRVMQFFDHFLKGAPAPNWMVNGVPARLKGMETGLELMNGSTNASVK